MSSNKNNLDWMKHDEDSLPDEWHWTGNEGTSLGGGVIMIVAILIVAAFVGC